MDKKIKTFFKWLIILILAWVFVMYSWNTIKRWKYINQAKNIITNIAEADKNKGIVMLEERSGSIELVCIKGINKE